MNKIITNETILDLLYRSFDEVLTPEQNILLAQALEQSDELRKEQQNIAAMRNLVTEKGGGSFKPFFSTRVMQRINSMQTAPERTELFDSLVHVFRRVALVAGIAVIVLFSVQLLHKDHDTNLASTTISDMTLDDVLGSAFSASLEEVL